MEVLILSGFAIIICIDQEASIPMHTDDSALASKESTLFRDALREVPARHSFTANEQALEQFIDEWERGTLPKQRWTHGAHVGVAAYFAFEYPADVLLRVMRLGIRHYNLASGGANTEDHGYHETLTRFWAGEVGEFVRGGEFGSRLEAVQAALARFGDRSDYFKAVYSFDVVGHREARHSWVAPDRSGQGLGAVGRQHSVAPRTRIAGSE
jgi:hypothetical protein